jgi:membrane protease YdiL (CAAX protease family)
VERNTQTHREQRRLLALLVALYALAAVIYTVLPSGLLASVHAMEQATLPDIPLWQMALGNALVILLLYLPAGLAGLWLARRADLPGMYRGDAGWRAWFLWPLGIGLLVGVAMVGFDLLIRQVSTFDGFPHPPFPASLLASFTAGIGEEILYRLLLMSLWAVVIGWLMRRLLPGRDTRTTTRWLANGLAALAFAAGHLGSAMVLMGAETPAALPLPMLLELVVLNGLVGLTAGWAFMRDGLVAAIGIHFWADVVWHVLYGLVA